MGVILSHTKFKNEHWSIDMDNLRKGKNFLYISFENSDTTVLDDLRFGYELRKDDNIKQYGIFPPPGIKYKKSDQKHLVSVALFLDPTETPTLYLWARLNHKQLSKQLDLKITG